MQWHIYICIHFIYISCMYKAIRTGRHGFHILCFLERVYRNESGLSSWGCAGHIVDGRFDTIRNYSVASHLWIYSQLMKARTTPAFSFSPVELIFGRWDGGEKFKQNKKKQHFDKSTETKRKRVHIAMGLNPPPFCLPHSSSLVLIAFVHPQGN